MPVSPQTDIFLELLAKSRLFAAEELDSLCERLGLREAAAAGAAAERLIRAGRLTRYQAQRLLAGHYRGFFLDQYRLLDVLGTGGMGRLFLADDGETGRQVALKVLSDRFQEDAGMLARLKLEARAGGRLDHPNVVRTYELARSRDGFGWHYIVMEFVPGIGLEELVGRRGACRPPQACDIIRQAAAGLQHAHDAGLVHRDLKPSNLLIDRQGTVKVADFGLALMRDRGEDEFSLNMIFGHECVGSAEYMAPEQAIDCRTVDARADIYALGCTFYALLTASVPFPGHSGLAAMKAHCKQRPRPVRDLAAGVPREVTAILDRMMAKRPEQRFASAGEVAQALEPFAQRMPVDFDFAAILAARAADARRRGHDQERRETRSRQTTTIIEHRPEPIPSVDGSSGANPGPSHDSRAGASRTARPSSDGPSAAEAAGRLAATSPTTPKASGVGAVMPPGAALIPLDGGEPIPLIGRRLLVGRGSECNVRLPSNRVSGRHCELRYDGRWWRITDLGSKNGTRVNGHEVKDQMLWPGDLLTIADLHTFRITTPPDRKTGRASLWITFTLIGLLLLALILWGAFFGMS